MTHEDSARQGRPGWIQATILAEGKGSGEKMDLLNISTSAGEAFSGFDWTEHAGKGVRLFVQGFG